MIVFVGWGNAPRAFFCGFAKYGIARSAALMCFAGLRETLRRQAFGRLSKL